MELINASTRRDKSRCEICLKTEYYDSINRYCTKCEGTKYRAKYIFKRITTAFGALLYYKQRFINTLTLITLLLTISIGLNFYLQIAGKWEIIARTFAAATMIINIIIAYTFFGYAALIKRQRLPIFIISLITTYISSLYIYRDAAAGESGIKGAFLFAILAWIGSWTAAQLIGPQQR
jgi:hypothetical protein